MHTLATRQCKPCTNKADLLLLEVAKDTLHKLNGWRLNHENTSIQRHFSFDDFSQTMAFINAVAWIAQQQNHHPEMQIAYKHCDINYTTHSIGGLTENDLICAAKINTLLDSGTTDQT